MFKKLRSLGGGSKGRTKFRLDVTVGQLEGLPDNVAQCRVVWARQAKVSVTKTVPVTGGTAVYNEELSQIATLNKDSKGNFESKEYQFKLQAPERGNPAKYVTLGKAALDMARYTSDGPLHPQALKIRMQMSGNRAAFLSVTVAAAAVKGMGDDDESMTSVVTGLSGVSGIEQDLSGFDGGDSRRASERGAGSSLQRVTEESESNGSMLRAKELSERDTILSRLEAELADAKARLAMGDVPQVATLTEENAQLKQDMEKLKKAAQQAEAAAVAAAKAAAAAPPAPEEDPAEMSVQLATARRRVAELEVQLTLAQNRPASAGSSNGASAERVAKLQKDLQDAQSTISSLQSELVQAKSLSEQATAASAAAAAAAAAAGSTVPPEVAARLSLYERKIQELMSLVEAAERPASEREAELEAALVEAEERLAELEASGVALPAANGGGGLRAKLASAEQELAEAENMATEALNLLESAQAENRHLQEQLLTLKRESDWQTKKAAKERADWEARMQDGFRRVEESVLLAERLQKDKDELMARLELAQAEKAALEAKLDPQAVDEQVAAEVERARVAAEAQARIEVEALAARMREMEEFVERADAARLDMAGKVSELSAALKAVKRDESESYDLVKEAEERADGLQLEMQYLQHEKERLESELELARQELDRAAAGAHGERAAEAARVAELAAMLEEARGHLRHRESESEEHRSRVMMLEEQLEASKLEVAELQQKLSIAMVTAGVAGAKAASTGAGGVSSADLEELKKAAQARAAQLEASSRELSHLHGELQQARSECDSLRLALQDAQRSAASAQSKVEQLQESLHARELQQAQMEQLQRDMAAAMLAAKEHSSTSNALGSQKDALSSQLAGLQGAHAAELSALHKQLDEAHRLADYSSRELAGTVQQLAEAESERGELSTKVVELRDEVVRLRAGDDGELRIRIAKLEKELLVTRNARDVNALFKTEHDRIASELIETKLLWAEAQEQLVKLKQSLCKSQEKTISFASKLTRLETKFYQKMKERKAEKKEKKRQKEREREAAMSSSSLSSFSASLSSRF